MKKVVLLIVFCSLLFFITGCSLKKIDELSDAEKFANEYSISENNPFRYASVSDVLEMFHNRSTILFLGNSDCEWSAFGARVLNGVLKKEKIEEVYYFNPDSIKHKQSKKYNEVMKLLDIDEDTSLPVVCVIHDGKVVDRVDYFVHENSSINEETTEQLENEYLNLISQYI